MVSIIISESCFCTFVCVVLTCLLINLFFSFLYFLMELMVLEEYRLTLSLSLSKRLYVLSIGCVFISKVFISVCFYIVFTLIFIHNFLLFANISIPKTGFYKYSTGGTFFLVLFYLIPFSKFLHRCFSRTLSLQNFNIFINTTGWECF